jgi:hypothetical protein
MGDPAARTLFASEYARSPKPDHGRLMIHSGKLAHIEMWTRSYVRFRGRPVDDSYWPIAACPQRLLSTHCRLWRYGEQPFAAFAAKRETSNPTGQMGGPPRAMAQTLA